MEWYMCGVDDPTEDSVAVWLVYESTTPAGVSRGIRTALCLWKKERFNPIKVMPNQPMTRIRGRKICWAYVTEVPRLPMLEDDGKGWRVVE